jgi:hypothetical protein
MKSSCKQEDQSHMVHNTGNLYSHSPKIESFYRKAIIYNLPRNWLKICSSQFIILFFRRNIYSFKWWKTCQLYFPIQLKIVNLWNNPNGEQCTESNCLAKTFKSLNQFESSAPPPTERKTSSRFRCADMEKCIPNISTAWRQKNFVIFYPDFHCMRFLLNF